MITFEDMLLLVIFLGLAPFWFPIVLLVIMFIIAGVMVVIGLIWALLVWIWNSFIRVLHAFS